VRKTQRRREVFDTQIGSATLSGQKLIAFERAVIAKKSNDQPCPFPLFRRFFVSSIKYLMTRSLMIAADGIIINNL
jgi:hypothetical protein